MKDESIRILNILLSDINKMLYRFILNNDLDYYIEDEINKIQKDIDKLRMKLEYRGKVKKVKK